MKIRICWQYVKETNQHFMTFFRLNWFLYIKHHRKWYVFFFFLEKVKFDIIPGPNDVVNILFSISPHSIYFSQEFLFNGKKKKWKIMEKTWRFFFFYKFSYGPVAKSVNLRDDPLKINNLFFLSWIYLYISKT